ncbi:hypothetical protein THRCLA_09165 [Thraustotheca clavata]|uniref:Uncharacterized protein n=1 Tax=Thraustotheca clavata TaxID=74557 RepID=A0A1V9YYV1_9STRA|nr:hypothetical protein THRCLA_09165 [Thraustotheca clavata]
MNMDAFLFGDVIMDDGLTLGLMKDDELARVFLDAKDTYGEIEQASPVGTKRKHDVMSLTSSENELIDKETARKNAKREAYKKHIRKRQNEHAELKQQVQELEDQLQFLTNMKAIDATFASNWENIARDLASHRQESTVENEKLRQKVAEQSEFIETLQTLLAKRPQLAVFENDEWKALRLVADPAKRLHGMNALLHRQRQLLTGVFLQCGLLECQEEPIHKVNVCSDITKMLISESVRLVKMDVPYPVLAEAAWNVSLGKEITEKWGDNYKILETIDPNTVYVEYVPRNGVADASGVLCARYLYRRYYEENRVVIIWKSILEDECYPLDESVMRVHQSGWMVIEDGNRSPRHDDTQLQEQVQALEAHLQYLSEMKAVDTSFAMNWQNLARDAPVQRQKRSLEIDTDRDFINAVQDLLGKRPRIAVFDNDEWKTLLLVADPEKRKHGMNALIHRQYQLLTGVYLQCGLLEMHTGDVHKLNVCASMENKNILGESVRFVRKNVPYNVLAEAAWNVSLGKGITEKWCKNYKTLEVLDANTVYVENVPRHILADVSGVVSARFLYRRYFEKNRVVIVWKSILEDECLPLDENVMRVHQSGWMVIEGDPKNPSQSLYKLFIQRHSPTRAGQLLQLTDIYQYIMPSVKLENRTTTYVTTFIEQSFRAVEEAFEKAIDVAVQKQKCRMSYLLSDD